MPVGLVRRWMLTVFAVVLTAGVLPACLVLPADTSQIALVSSTTVGNWKFDFYRNSAYRCAVSGFQTFVVGTRVGSSATASAPLWVWMHGDGVGWFDSSGTPQPDASQLSEESASSLQTDLTNGGLLARVRNSQDGFRLLAVSYCDRDLYAGTGEPDVNNPHLQGTSVHQTNGLQATKAAVQYVTAHYTTSNYILSGGGSGSAGARTSRDTRCRRWGHRQQASLATVASSTTRRGLPRTPKAHPRLLNTRPEHESWLRSALTRRSPTRTTRSTSWSRDTTTRCRSCTSGTTATAARAPTRRCSVRCVTTRR